MLNQVILVGRLIENPINEENKIIITIGVNRAFKNENGEYETDVISCVLWEGIAKSATEYLVVGDVIGIRGRLQTINDKLIVVANKVTFLSAKKKEEE